MAVFYHQPGLRAKLLASFSHDQLVGRLIQNRER